MSQPEQRVPDVSSGTEVTPEQVADGEQALQAAGSPGGGTPVDRSSDAGTTIDAEAYDPAHARAELAGETPPHADAEEMESALRERGRPLAEADPYAGARRAAPTEAGPGTSLT